MMPKMQVKWEQDTVTAFYEVVLAGIKSDLRVKNGRFKISKTKPTPAVTNNSKELLITS